jgi:hypothetical protein
LLASGGAGPSVFAYQLSNLDADRNGVVNTQDVDYLLKVNFGLYYFVTNVVVTTPSQPSCLLNITVSLLSGGGAVGDSPAADSSSFLFVDLEATDDALTVQLQDSSVVVGASTGVSKGSGYNG